MVRANRKLVLVLGCCVVGLSIYWLAEDGSAGPWAQDFRDGVFVDTVFARDVELPLGQDVVLVGVIETATLTRRDLLGRLEFTLGAIPRHPAWYRGNRVIHVVYGGELEPGISQAVGDGFTAVAVSGLVVGKDEVSATRISLNTGLCNLSE